MSTSQDRYADYLQTDHWKRVSDAVKRKANYRCQVCNSPHDLNAHHRTYENKGRELDHLDDLVCLCRRCHAVFHGKADGMGVALARSISSAPPPVPVVLAQRPAPQIIFQTVGKMPSKKERRIAAAIVARMNDPQFAPSGPVLVPTTPKLKDRISGDEYEKILAGRRARKELRYDSPPPPRPPYPDLVLNQNGTVTLTSTLWRRLMTPRGGMRNCQIKAMGVEFPLIGGWAEALIGKEMDPKIYERAWNLGA